MAEGFIYKKYVEQNISSNYTQAKEKQLLVKAADAGLQQADSAFIRGANSEAEFLLNASTIALDIAISVGPLGWAKFGYEAFTKKDFLTGHPLNSVSHGLAIAAFTVSIIAMAATAEIGLPVLAGAAGVELIADMLKASTELDAGAGATAEVAEIAEAVRGAERALDSAETFGLKTGEEVKTFVTDLASPKRSNHILQGDATGGGHMFPGKQGKTVFQASWSGDKILHEASDIVTDPSIKWETNRTVRGIDRFKARGVRDGVEIEVIVEPKGEGIISAWPVSDAGIIRNPS